MKKLVSLTLALCLLCALAGCGGAPSSAPAPSAPAAASAPAVAPSSAPQSAAPVSSAPPAYVQRLTPAFYENLANLVADHGFLGLDEQRMSKADFDGPADIEAALNGPNGPHMILLWYVVWLEQLAAEDGNPTPYNLYQYAEDMSNYRIPAAQYAAALESWFGVAYDVTTLAVEIPEGHAVWYNAEDDTITILVSGLGSTPGSGAEVVELREEGGATVATVQLINTMENNAPVGEVKHLRVRENADGSYTLLGLAGFDAL